METFEILDEHFYRVMYPTYHKRDIMYKQLHNTYPYTDVWYNEEEDLIIDIALTGYKKDNIKIELDGRLLKVTGDYKSESNRKYDFEGIKKSNFTKSYVLPKFYDKEPSVSYEDGILKIVFKKDENKKKKLIEIK